MLVGTAGHIDHGKTTLVKALTGVDADRLPEEKKRGITVDLGYAYTPLSNGSVLGFVDVPGHEKLIHNMLAGATSIDFVLLVIAADDGPMPQTREHLELLELLGLNKGVIAITKTDAVSAGRLQEVQQEVAELVATSVLQDSPLFLVSSLKGDGVNQLKAYLDQQALALPVDDAGGRFRLAIDRAFTLKGVGTVVTGTALAGKVVLDDELKITPAGFNARVRGLHVQDQKAESGHAGQRCAIALKGDFEKKDIHRGMWLLDSQLAMPLSRFQGYLKVPASQKAVKHLQTVHVHLGTEDIVGRVGLLDCKKVEPGETALVEIQLDRDTLAINGDRFILRDAGAQRTVGGGRVLDIFPPKRYKRTDERLHYLKIASELKPSKALQALLPLSTTGVDLQQFAWSWNLDETSIKTMIAELKLKVVTDGDTQLVFSALSWQGLKDKLLEKLQQDHEQAPDMVGVEPSRLRRMVSVKLVASVFETLCLELIHGGKLIKTRAWYHLPDHKAVLSEEDRKLFMELKPLLDSAAFNPPRVRDVARQVALPEYEVRRLFKRLSRVGELYPIARDHYYTAEAIAELAEVVRHLNDLPLGARIATLRDEVFSDGSGGRKVATQILEFFDRVGYTRRLQDEHVLRDPDAEQAWNLR